MAGAKTHPPTPRKTNMSPENQWLEDVFPIEIVGDMLVFGSVDKDWMKDCKSNNFFPVRVETDGLDAVAFFLGGHFLLGG